MVENYDGSMLLLYEGALLAVLVVWLFLRDWRATLVAATALPLSIIPTFAVMHYVFGFTLNVVTLLSLSLVVGILVDDAIVEIENIMRHLRMGKTPFQAAMEAADEIGLAVIATTFTLIAVFLPTAFMSGVPGKFFVQFGWTAAIAVFFSLVVARMLTPMMAAYILQAAEEGAPRAALDRRSTWAGPLVPEAPHRSRCWRPRCSSSARSCCAGLLPTGFLPPDDLSQTQVAADAAARQHASSRRSPRPKQARADGAEEPAREAGLHRGRRRHHRQRPLRAGAARPRSRKATLTINMTPRSERRGISKQDIEAELREALAVLPGARVKVGFGGSRREVRAGAGRRRRPRARRRTRSRSSASCAASPASATSPAAPAWCGPN